MTEKDDVKVMDGGPLKDGQTPDGKDPKPEQKVETPTVKLIEVEIGGVKASVPEAFVSEYKAMHAQYGTMRQELDELKKASAKKAVDTSTDDPLANIDVELFSDPAAAVAKILAEAEKRAYNRITTDLAVTDARKDFWDAFYKAHTDLDRETDGDVVNAVMNREYTSLSALKVPEAIKLLGEKSKAQLIKIAQKRGGDGKPIAEGGNEPSKKGSKDVDSSASTHSGGLSGEIRARRAARMSGAKA